MFQRGQISVEERITISGHLDTCEFCLAEVEFYTHYPQTNDEWVEPSPIPLPLYELATAILRRGKDGPAWLDGLLNSSKNN
jgi:hypothetical protein